MRVLTARFFARPTVLVAKSLLGKYLCRRIGKKKICRMITEVEAYDGPHDKACHASHGRTKRTEVMFGEAGIIYVHMVYGMHYCFNMVCGKINYPAAVLVRGTDNVNGPGRVAKFFKINKKLNGETANRKTGLWIEDKGTKISKSNIKRSKRVGVDYAGRIWANKLYNFSLIHNLLDGN